MSRRPRPAVVVLSVGVAALLGVYVAVLVVLRPPAPGRQLSLDELSRAAAEGRVVSARFLDEDARITGMLGRGAATQRFWAAYPRSDAATGDLLKTLSAGGTRVLVDSQTGKATVRFVAQFLLPIVILANLFALLFYLVRGGGGGTQDFLQFGRVGDKRVPGGASGRVTFADLAGAEAEVAEFAEVRDYLADPSAFREIGALPPKGVLLVGPPGCGKTLLARAVAGEARATFYTMSGSAFVESLVGVGAARVRDLFTQARANAPAIVFIDELDAAGRQRGAGLGGGHDEREQTLNELLVQMDGFSPAEGVVVIGATNRPDILDPALLRAGRFDRRITVERPDNEGRRAILRLHAKSKRLADPETDLPYIARRTPGFTGADLASMLNEAALLAVRGGAREVARHHLEEAVDRVVSGPRQTVRLIPAAEKQRIAVHEAGHAVVAAAIGKASAVEKVSVVARGRGMGHVGVLDADKAVLTRGDMHARIAIALAGVAAEEIVFGEPSTGSESDLEAATATARDMAGRYGMTRLGRMRVLREHGKVFLGRDYLASQDVSQPTLEHLDAEVRRILDEEEETARTILSTNRPVLDALAVTLVEHETLQGPDLEAMLAAVSLHHRPSKGVTNGAARSARGRKA